MTEPRDEHATGVVHRRPVLFGTVFFFTTMGVGLLLERLEGVWTGSEPATPLLMKILSGALGAALFTWALRRLRPKRATLPSLE